MWEGTVMTDWLGITFARPSALWLLALLPVFALVGVLFGVRRRGLPRAALPLRMGVIALLAITLAEPMLTQRGGAASTVFVVDRSKSISSDTADQIDSWLASALDDAGANDRAAVVTFGAEADVAASAARARDVGRDWQGPEEAARENTDIETALALARALPLGGARRIVLVSDGAENIGAAMNQAGQAAADGVPIDVLPVAGVGDSDLRVEGATAPASIWLGETVNVLTSIASGVGGDGRLELLVDGVSKQSEPMTFPAGLSSHTFEVRDLAPGFHSLTVKVTGTTATDRYAENNEFPLALIVRDAPKLLLVSQQGTDTGRLKAALERQRAVVTTVVPADVSSRLSELGQYDAILLNNVPASALTIDQMTALRETTRTKGRGLIVLGGTSSYGPGNYSKTILEDTLPVTVRSTDGRERPRIALLIIFDKSGSMSYDPLGGTSKIDMAKEAVRVAAQAVADGDEVGILSFNDQQQWVLPMTTVAGQQTRDEIDRVVAAVTADGGTEIYPALNVGFDAILRAEADVRHVILLSDGKSRTGTDASYKKLIDDSKSSNLTLSTIAIGDDADTELMQKLAEWGDGRYHFVEKADDIPRVTLQEAQSAGSQSVIRGSFQPIQKLPRRS
jgi:Ca-activated chloride channel family protein